MKVKENLSTYTHRRGHQTTISKLVTLDVDGVQRKFKFSYDAYNAGETFGIELFDGDKFNHICSMSDLGFTRDNSLYVHSESEIKTRAEVIFKKGIEYIKLLY
jgi:hypothetical protein